MLLLKIKSLRKTVIGNAVRNPEHYGQQADGVVLDISHFPAGVYFVKIQTETGEIVRKVVKQ